MPSGIPIARATTTATMTRASVSRLSSQRPITPMNSNPPPASAAIRQPASSPATVAAAVATPSHVMRDRAWISWSTTALMPSFSGTRRYTNSGCVR
jgi:hypothetical protein